MKYVFERFYKNQVDKTSMSCTPLSKIDVDALDYRLNTKGECVITECSSNLKPSIDGKKCEL